MQITLIRPKFAKKNIAGIIILDMETDPVCFAHVFQAALPSSALAYTTFTAIGKECRAYSERYGAECELEARFGVFDRCAESFTSGVSEAFYLRVLELCRESTRWAKEESTEYEDAFYTYNGQTYRTRSAHKSGSGILVTTCVKERKQNWTFKTKVTPVEPTPPLPDIRISLCREKQVDTPEVFVDTTRYAIVQQYSFFYVAREYSTDIIRIDVRRSWTGQTRSEAEERQRSAGGTLTVEVEVINPHFFNHRFGPSYAALSLLVKLMDFLRHASETATPCSAFSIQVEPSCPPKNKLC